MEIEVFSKICEKRIMRTDRNHEDTGYFKIVCTRKYKVFTGK